ncbi:MAG: Orotate phosphoribosyltransferase [Turneriella sp.]|nr:Orotate phosphoribosyltransferase [Turneriella sp.]
MQDLDTEKKILKEAIRLLSYRENHETLFTLASGKKSPYYFDLKQTLLNPEYLRLAGRVIRMAIGKNYPDTVIASGLTMGADPIIYSACLSGVAVPNKIFPAIVRKEAKDHGTGKKIEMLKGIENVTPCVMVDDVITTAGSTLKAVAAMREAGFTVKHAYCILDRGEGGREALLNEKIELVPVFTAAEFRQK